MTLYVSKITHFKEHRLLVVGTFVPNILEYIFLFRRMKPCAFVGRGTKWYHYPNEKPIPKGVAKQLEKVINTMKIYG
jgi:hypothetical protein